MSTKDVAVFVGSLRKGSFSRKLAHALIELAPETLKFSTVDIGGLPLYNPDLESEVPATWTAFRARLERADAMLFVTPEYNRSIPGGLKNAFDVGSRPVGSSVWNGKPGAVISTSTGVIGGFGANQHLRQSMVALNVPMMQQPEAYLGRIDTVFDAQGSLNASTREFLGKYLQAFKAWVGRNT